jgi:predicted aldo/keto reductase-like oxidoreductase
LDAYFDQELGAIDFLLKQKEEGRIKHLGFSTHAGLPALEKFLQVHGKNMEFCQIQLNYLDWNWQNAAQKVELLKKYNIPIWVMEPLRGGSLASLPEKSMNKVQKLIPSSAPIDIAFSFLRTIPEVTMILSGMSDLEQLKENISIFSQDSALSAETFRQLPAIGMEMIETVPCTACRYCTEYCPQSLDIPTLIRMYNENRFNGSTFALNALPDEKKPSACLGCRQCEAVCPQNILISERLKELAEKQKP